MPGDAFDWLMNDMKKNIGKIVSDELDDDDDFMTKFIAKQQRDAQGSIYSAKNSIHSIDKVTENNHSIEIVADKKKSLSRQLSDSPDVFIPDEQDKVSVRGGLIEDIDDNDSFLKDYLGDAEDRYDNEAKREKPKKDMNLWSWLAFLIYSTILAGDGVKNAIAIKEEGITVSGAIDLAADATMILTELVDLVWNVKAAHDMDLQLVASGERNASTGWEAFKLKTGSAFQIYAEMMNMGNRWFYLSAAAISAIEAANGSGSPVTGGAFTDGAADFNQVHTKLQSAAPNPIEWSGEASEKYRIKNSGQQNLAEQVADASRNLAGLLQKQASQVEITRTALASIKLALGPPTFVYSILCRQLLLALATPGVLSLAETQALKRRCTLYLRWVGIVTWTAVLGVVTASLVMGKLTAKSVEAETNALLEVARQASSA